MDARVFMFITSAKLLLCIHTLCCMHERSTARYPAPKESVVYLLQQLTPLTTATRMAPNRIRIRMVALTTAMIITMLPDPIAAGVGTVEGSTAYGCTHSLEL